jgi:AraC-like DNA-binding protein
MKGAPSEFRSRQVCGILRHMTKVKLPPAPAPLRLPASYGRALVNQFGRTQDGRASLLANADTSESAIATWSAEIDVAVLLRIVAAVTEAEGEDWPLRAGQVWANAMQGALDVAARSARTLGDAIAILAKYGRVRAPYLAVKLVRSRRAAQLLLDRAVDMDEPAWRSIAYAVTLSVHAMLAQMCERALDGGRVTFPWRSPPFAQRLREASSFKLEFAAPQFMIEIPAEWCAQPSPFADPDLHASAIADLELAGERQRGSNDVVRDAIRVIVGQLPHRVGEERVASLLGQSRRTLVRKLTAAGTSYRTLLDRALRERAAAMLARDDMSRTEMAAALGYADPTSFSRACRRWFGAPKS